MVNSYHFICPQCSNASSFYRYGKDPSSYQKDNTMLVTTNAYPIVRGWEKGNPSERASGGHPLVSALLGVRRIKCHALSWAKSMASGAL